MQRLTSSRLAIQAEYARGRFIPQGNQTTRVDHDDGVLGRADNSVELFLAFLQSLFRPLELGYFQHHPHDARHFPLGVLKHRFMHQHVMGAPIPIKDGHFIFLGPAISDQFHVNGGVIVGHIGRGKITHGFANELFAGNPQHPASRLVAAHENAAGILEINRGGNGIQHIIHQQAFILQGDFRLFSGGNIAKNRGYPQDFSPRLSNRA